MLGLAALVQSRLGNVSQELGLLLKLRLERLEQKY